MAAETKIIIGNIPPYDGEYDFDVDQALSTREWRWVKKISEGEINPSNLREDDPDFIVAVAVIAMHRAGKITREQVLDVADKLSDAPLDAAHISLVVGDEAEADEIPPASAVEPERSLSNGSAASDNSTSSSSRSDGSSSRSPLDRSGESLEPIGISRSATSLDLDLGSSTT